MPGFQQRAGRLFSPSRRQRRVGILVDESGLEFDIARTYDTAAESNLRRDYGENPPRGEFQLDRMVAADQEGASSQDLFHISVERETE